jgi:hypothetical protein
LLLLRYLLIWFQLLLLLLLLLRLGLLWDLRRLVR